MAIDLLGLAILTIHANLVVLKLTRKNKAWSTDIKCVMTLICRC